MKSTIIAASALSLAIGSLAIPTTTTTATNAKRASSPTAQCLYTALPSATAYAAYLPNRNLTAAAIENYFDNFVFTCQAGQAFDAHLLTADTTYAGSWFGGIEYSGDGTQCSPGLFASAVGAAMQYENQGANYTVACTPYAGEDASPFEQDAAAYFGKL